MDNLTGYQLSARQKKLWALGERLGHGRISGALMVRGNPHSEDLKQALKELVGKHPVLRLDLNRLPGMVYPVCEVGEPLVHWQEEDWSHVSDPYQAAARLYKAEASDCRRPRFTYARLDESSAWLLVSLSALTADTATLIHLAGWIARQIDGVAGDAEMNYIHFAEWTLGLEDTHDEAALEARDFWSHQAVPVSLHWPWSPPVAGSNRQGFLRRSSQLAGALMDVSDNPAGFLLTCWKTLLWRLTGSDHIPVAVIMDGRKYDEMDGILGPCSRALLLETRFDADICFKDLADELTERAGALWQHQEYAPWAENGLRAAFEWVGQETASHDVLDLHLQWVADFSDDFDLKILCLQDQERLTLNFTYKKEVTDHQTTTWIADYFETLLEQFCREPNSIISEPTMITPSNRKRLLVDWNNTHMPYDRDCCFIDMFEEQAARTPDTPAVRYMDQQLTYKQLDGVANQIARVLLQEGAGPEAPIALALERSTDMIAALWGIFKAGSAYVPLPLNHPKDRLAGIMTGAGAGILVTTSDLLPALPEFDGTLLVLDGERARINAMPDSRPPRTVTADHLAHIIATSGSTGKPKQIAVRHGSVVNFLIGLESLVYHDEPEPVRIGLNEPISFDGSLKEYLLLARGHQLHIFPEAIRLDGPAFCDYLTRYGIEVFGCTPTQLELLIDAGLLEMKRGPRKVMLSGEHIGQDLWDKLAACETIKFYNLYGVTETTVDTAIQPIEGAVVNFGRPMANTHLYLLDKNMEPTPPGVRGNLMVGGEGLARGYAGAPALTALHFIPNPFADRPGERLYRTGDQAIYLGDGRIQYKGRADFQIKLRGFRIELAEIETVLENHPQITRALVMLREDFPGEQRLAAYYTGHQTPPDREQLRSWLLERLPDHMIPDFFTALDAFPLGRNGKPDRKALPAPENPATANREEPVTPMEKLIAEIWCDLLHLEQIGRQDDFFAIGGHSLLATRFVSKLRVDHDLEIPLFMVLEYPVLASLAEQVQDHMDEMDDFDDFDDFEDEPLLEPVPRDLPIPLSFAQQRLWFLQQMDPENPGYNMPDQLLLKGDLNVPALERTLGEVIDRHESLRTVFVDHDGIPVQKILEKQNFHLPFHDLSQLPEQERESRTNALAEENAGQPFDLTQGPLMRVALVKIDETTHRLLITMHHIISDAWSAGVLIKEVKTIYQAYSSGQDHLLPPLPIQYADFAVWQRQRMQGPLMERQLDFWQRQLAGFSNLELPTDRPRPAEPDPVGGQHSFHLEPDLTTALNTLARRNGATLFMVLLAAYHTLLKRLSNQQDIVVGVDIANRNRAQLESLIGFFVNMLPIRARIEDHQTFRDILEQIVATTSEAYENQDIPFDKVVDAMGIPRELSRNPIFQVIFVYQNVPMESLEMPGLEMTPMGSEEPFVRFDLALFMIQQENGLDAVLRYNAGLFDPQTIASWVTSFRILLKHIVQEPEEKVKKLAIAPEKEARENRKRKKERKASRLGRLRGSRRRGVNLEEAELVRSRPLLEDRSLPLLVERHMARTDLAEWATANQNFISTALQQYGAILFRGFDIDSPAIFEQTASVLCSELYGDYGDLPRQEAGGKIYGSTPYPADKSILYHSESSHMHCWPLQICFHCDTAARSGGETPIVDCREVYRRMDPALAKRFEEKGLMYMRNFIDGLDVSWMDFFGTDDRERVAEICRANGVSFQWISDSHLKTRETRYAVARRPGVDDPVFFNQIFLHHESCLDPALRASLLEVYGPEQLPRNVFFGDGTPIEDDTVAHLLELYDELAVRAPWQQGDIMLLDNMLTAHGRAPFQGPRKILVAMGRLYHPEHQLEKIQ